MEQSNDSARKEEVKRPVIYTCGNCYQENQLGPKDVIRCHNCGFRIMYKKRTNRMMVFDGR